ncbi:hypothetical protein PUNSTDRAFT_138655 [Punctularia strigosozonata HHB-11173 SS5]|uniref:BTB domain-containing protein n=1 Tax=Punctularia strigosozonata (strain HHB-11173) TaxID=741275 RepID=R7S349_PUNST|nr:uncharacterized protein PUNSTDRAFT_138655 [Punctularia strigosozonata HHB-11173 SS5]EIN04259.1 hypothetical protein PUNSTDRAFT_138655 [Punctularia strigosozonata HHB-11173 SS5]
MSATKLSLVLEDQSGHPTKTHFDDIYDRLFLRISSSPLPASSSSSSSSSSLSSSSSSSPPPPPSNPNAFERTVMIHNMGQRWSRRRGHLLHVVHCNPSVVIAFGANATLGTVTFPHSHHPSHQAQTAAIMPISKYLRKVSVFGSSLNRKFMASDGQEYRWCHRTVENVGNHEWACVGMAHNYIIAHYDLKPPEREGYGRSGHTLTIEEPYARIAIELWYEDGTIILVAQDVGFKVYRMLLAQHSSVFADMLAISSPETNHDLVHGCPLVHMPDPVDDLRLFLLAIHDIRVNQRLNHASHEETISVASLAAKYDIPHLRDRALERFVSFYPTTLDRWTIVHDQPSSLTAENHYSALRLARKLDLASTFPVIMLAICDHGIRGILSCAPEPEDLSTLLLGFSKLQNMQRAYVYRWLYRLSSGCTSPGECSADKGWMLSALEYTFQTDTHYALGKGYSEDHLAELGICGQCLGDAIVAQKHGRQHAWEELPSIFGLPTWAELLNDSGGDSDSE